MTRPNVVVLGGANGSGKTTAAPALLKGTLRVSEFVNADTIAQGLSGFNPEGSAIEAGRIMLRRMKQLAEQRADFAFESTLASRGLASWIQELTEADYEFHLVFLWLPDADVAVARVAERVRFGGHDIPEDVVRRRYEMGLRNFLTLYRPLATTWFLYDNSQPSGPRLIGKGGAGIRERIADPPLWQRISRNQ